MKSRIKYGKVVLYTLLHYFVESNDYKGYNVDKYSYGRMVSIMDYGFTLGVIVVLLIIAGVALLVVKACDESAKAKGEEYYKEYNRQVN